jgi:aspartyl protease
MKKIPLNVYNFAGDLRIMAHFFLKVEELSKSIPIRAIVDTGSPMTLIGPLDTGRMRISKIQLNKIRGRHRQVNIGGGQVIAKIVDNSKLTFGDGFEVNMPVEFPIEGQNNPHQPSLLGVDFLLKTKSKLVFDPTKKEAYLEIEE